MKTEKQIIKFFEMNKNEWQNVGDGALTVKELASLCNSDTLFSRAYREGVADALAWVLNRDGVNPRTILEDYFDGWRTN